MAQRFIELTDAETNRAVWIDPECIAVLRVVMREKEPYSDVTAVTYKVGTMREVAVVKQMPGEILELAGMKVLTPERAPLGHRTTVAVVAPHEVAMDWCRQHATCKDGRWHRNVDGAVVVIGNAPHRFVGHVFDEVLTLSGADPYTADHVENVRMRTVRR